MESVIRIISTGILATIAIDAWATFANRVLELPRTNWAMVGRWVGHVPRGRIAHTPIAASAPIKYELLLGWIFHYLIGIVYAATYFSYVHAAQAGVPTLGSAFTFGLITILSPWFIMQPGLGLGICATKAPRPNLVRLQNLVIHSIFGLALYYGWSATSLVD